MCTANGLRAVASACAIVASLGYAVPAGAQAYPGKPIRFIVPFTAGGAIDIVARTVTQKLTENLNIQMVVDNRSGAGGNVGAEIAAKSPSDGYHIFVCNITNAVYPSLYRKRLYDPLRDFAPITLAASFAYILSVHPAMPVTSVRELVGLAKRRPGEIAYGSSGVGSPPHFAGEMMGIMTGIRMIHAPYGGNPDAQRDLLGGHIQVLFINTANALPLIRAGRVRGLAVSSPRRSELAPEFPTLTESGLPGFDINSWAGFCAPARTSAAVVTRLNAEFTKALASPEVKKRLLTQGFELAVLPPADFLAYLKAEIDKYAKLVKDAKIEVQ